MSDVTNGTDVDCRLTRDNLGGEGIECGQVEGVWVCCSGSSGRCGWGTGAEPFFMADLRGFFSWGSRGSCSSISSWPFALSMGEPGWDSSSEKSPLVAIFAVVSMKNLLSVAERSDQG